MTTDAASVGKEVDRVSAKKTFKVGRDARTGRFIPVEVARVLKATAVVETMKVRKSK